MDKVRNDRRISILLNGKETRFEEETKNEQAIHNEEICATVEEKEEEQAFSWILVEEEQQKKSGNVVDLGEHRQAKKKLGQPFWDDGKSESAPKLPFSRKKKSHTFLKENLKQLPLGLIGIVLSAIIVGVSFGFMMLTIFTGDNVPIQVQPEVVHAAQISSASPATATSVTDDVGAIPSLDVEVIQGGAFSDRAKGGEVVQSLKNNGYAAVLTNTAEPAYLFIGVGIDRQQLAAVASKYTANGQDVYMKTYTVASNGKMANKEEAFFLQTGANIFKQLVLLSSSSLANGSIISQEALSELAAENKKIQELAVFQDNETLTSHAVVFKEALTSALTKYTTFLDTKDEGLLWDVQQSLLDGLVVYGEIVHAVE